MNLHGLRVVVTRPLEQSSRLAAAIDAAGGDACVFPLIEIGPPPDARADVARRQRKDHEEQRELPQQARAILPGQAQVVLRVQGEEGFDPASEEIDFGPCEIVESFAAGDSDRDEPDLPR